jgi:3-hydroxyisobutyrate dehydrogenase-like beta-hydroxyacid dehydrogenase
MSKIGFVGLGIMGTPINACPAQGGKAWGHSAMLRALEKLANFEIGQQAFQAD